MLRDAFFLICILFLAIAAFFLPQPAVPAPVSPQNYICYRYVIDSRRSRISFTFRGLVLPFDGHLSALQGEITLRMGKTLRKMTGTLRIEAASVFTEDPIHLKMMRNQVLEAGRYPAIEMEITSVDPVAPSRVRGREKEYEFRARGAVRMHGVKKSGTFPVRLSDTGTSLFVNARGMFRLSDFGMSRPRVLLLVPGHDQVEVRIRLIAHPAPK
jgi:polyisoprenoid-binding protein YceI